MGGDQQPQAPQAPPDQTMAAAAMGGMARQQQLQMQAAQLAAQVRARAAQPLSWGTAPPGSGVGQLAPPPPGVTLNSMGGQNG
jgi:hypothetical protein